MKIDIVNKTRRYSIIITFLSIISLLIISLIPWISIAENDGINENLHFSYEMMRGSDNTQIQDLASILSYINILFLAIIVVALVSFIFFIYYTLFKKSVFGPILRMILGIIPFVSIILIIYFQIVLSRSIRDIDTISASMMHTNIAYAYILFIISIILLIYSTISIITISVYSIKQFKSSTLHKKEKIEKINQKGIPKKLDKKEIELSTKKPLTDEPSKASNMVTLKSEMEEWLEDNPQSIEKKDFEEEQLKTDTDTEKIIIPSYNKKTFDENAERPEKDNQKIETPINEDKSSFEPFQSKKSKEKIDEIDKELSMQSFENHEKQDNTSESEIADIKELKPELMFQTEKIFLEKQGGTIKEIFNLRCLQCNNVFSHEKEKVNQKITCPKCGKEGTAKKEF